jgi:hypothetical protein
MVEQGSIAKQGPRAWQVPNGLAGTNRYRQGPIAEQGQWEGGGYSGASHVGTAMHETNEDMLVRQK